MTVFKYKFKLGMFQKKKNLGNKIKDWLSKWDRTIAGITAVVIFFALLGLVIVNMKIFDEDSTDSDSSNSIDYQVYRRYVILPGNDNSDKKCQFLKEVLTCSNFERQELIKAINDAAEQQSQYYVEKLELEEVNFENNQIENGWLVGINLTFQALKIADTTLSQIGEKAFSGDPFSILSSLTLSNTKVTFFEKKMFEDTKISSLEITYNSFSIITVEENAFGAISQTLTSLQLQRCLDNEILLNITGSNAELKHLSLLDVRHNEIGELKASTFTKVTMLKSLFLGNSEINKIEPNTFDSLDLETLDLSYNDFKTLPNNIFANVVKGKISIDGNLFECNCDLEWLNVYVDVHNNSFTNPDFNCTTDHGVVSHTTVDFCPNTTTSPTEITTTNPTPTPPTFQITCQNHIRTSTLYTSDDPHLLDTYRVKVREESVILQFTHNVANQNKYTLRITGNVSLGEAVLWSKRQLCVGCLSVAANNVDYELYLEDEETYIFCLMPRPTDAVVSPVDCGALTTAPPLEKRTWLPNKLKIPIICATSGIILVAVIISGCIVFYCIRQHPSLIKGNKRVIMVESEAADAVIMPKTYYDEITYRPPSLNSCSNGYLTPKYNRRINPHYLRTISERTPFVVPSTCTIGRYRRGHYKRKTRSEICCHALDDHIYEPPPLPPNHPLELRSYDIEV